MVKFVLIVLCAMLTVSMAQQYRPFGSPVQAARRVSTEGRYVSDNSGRYNANDGRYRPDSAGRYNPDGSGVYNGNNGQYNPDGLGGYSGGGGQYTGQNEKYRGDGSGSGSGSGGSGVGTLLIGGGIGSGRKPVLTAPITSAKTGKYSGHYAILRQEGHVDEDGYHYLYETENGITGEEQGKLANRGTPEEAMRANGFYTYTGPDNVVYTVRYTADENGFVPEGDHIPKTPVAILRSLEYQRAQGVL